MKINFLKIGANAIVLSLLLTASCKKEDPIESNDTPPASVNYKKTGFVVNTATPSGSSLVKYYEELPSGQIDVSDGKDYQAFYGRDQFDGAIFLDHPDNLPGFSKIAVNMEGEIYEEGFISVVAQNSYQIKVQNSSRGVFQDRNDLKISVFNPSDMTISGTIDMSSALVPQINGADVVPRYQTFYFRDNLVFAPIRETNGGVFDNLIIHVADMNTGNFVKSIEVPTGPVTPFNSFGGTYEDEMDNLYIPDQGDVNTGIPSKLHRINAGETEVDMSYEFSIAQVLNPMNLMMPIFTGFNYIGNGKALALVATDTPVGIMQMVQDHGYPNTWTDQLIQQALQILYTEENGRWCLVDVNSKSVTPISGLPGGSVFSTTMITEYNGKLLIPITTNSINAVYTYDITSGAAEKAFDVIGGAIVGVHSLSSNN